jgi:membrane protein YqaA with SNARE-associated domain
VIWADGAALAGLFAAAFVAATLLPAQSELVLAGLLAAGRIDPAVLFAVATAGNVLGSLFNWGIGRFLGHHRDRRWFPVKPAHIDRAAAWFGRWGVWSLLFAWLPVVGDPLTLVAGILRVNVWLFLTLVTLGKAARYAAIAAVLVFP